MPEPVADPESPSEVLRASHVLVVQVESARFGDWTPEEDGPLKRRFVELHVVLDEVLRGRTDQICGETLVLLVRQRGSGSMRISDDYGVWSKPELGAGERLVAFSAGDAKDATELLQPPLCQLVTGPGVLPELRTVIDLEGRALEPKPLLAHAALLLERRGGVLARYLWARTRAAAFADQGIFEGLMKIVEAPGTALEARDVLFTAAHQDLALLEMPPQWAPPRLARAMLVALATPAAAPIHAMLAQVYLPNLIGLTSGTAVMAVGQLAPPISEVVSGVQAILVAQPDLDPQGHLRRWLAEGLAHPQGPA